MTGVADYLPVMADCERALGRPQQALALAREAERARPRAGPAHRDDDRRRRRPRRPGPAGRGGADAARGGELPAADAGPDPPLTRGAAAQAVEQEQQAAARLRYAYADALLQTRRDRGGAADVRRRRPSGTPSS